LLEPFYTVFCRFTREAGTPVFGRSFLQNVVTEFAGSFNIVVVWLEDTPVGGYFQLELGDTAYGIWGAALRDYLNLRPVHLAMWEIMANLTEHGFACLDMGRSPANSNASQFKGQWGGMRAPVYQQVQRLNDRYREDAVANGVDQDESFRLFMRVWPKLPLSVTQYIGPHLRRHLPFA
jgi:CelD/BcsL family acetyltransferase involved in cellulose biosynthesis